MTSLPSAKAPVTTPVAPNEPLPTGACDAHVHIVGDDFRLWEGRVEDPAPGALSAWLTLLDDHLAALGFDRTLIVHSILYGADNAITLAALDRMGDRARGIALVRDGAQAAELDALAARRIVGVRLNYVHGGVLSWEGAKALAPALAERGMHLQILLNAHRHMDEIAADIRALPVPVVFDHLGWPDLHAGPDEPGFRTLCALLAEGRAYVKLSGIYRLCPPPHDAVAPLVAALVAANPDGCLWGSDWPHLMLADAARPDAGLLLNAFLDTVTDRQTRQRILVGTPARLFGFA